MLHLLPQSASETTPQPYAEAVARLASIRHALQLVGDFGSGPASDMDEGVVAAAWSNAGEARQHCFDNRSSRLVGAAAAGLEALLAERQQGREPHAEAGKALVDQIRRELAQVSRVILG